MNRLVSLSLIGLAGVVGCPEPTTSLDAGVPVTDANAPPPPPSSDAGVSPPACEDPGFVPLRRMSRSAYGNALSDLLGFDVDTSRLPDDDVGYGFNHISEVLSVSAVHLEYYEAIVREAVAHLLRTTPPAQRETRHAVDDCQQSVGGVKNWHGTRSWNLWSNGRVYFEHVVPVRGVYELRAFAWAQQGGDELARMSLSIDDVTLGQFDVASEDGRAMETKSVRVELEPGHHLFSAHFLNDFYQPGIADRNLYVGGFELEGPFEVELDESIRARWVPCAASGNPDEACVRTSATNLARAAWRRAVSEDEVNRLVALARLAVDSGGTWEEGLAMAFQAVLLSPNFLYFVEPDPAPEPSRLSGYELATRLSFLLWNSLPDEALLAAAGDGSLDTDEGVTRETLRMLGDPKAQRLVAQFFGQWLELDVLDRVDPDYNYFPEFDDDLRAAMRRETELLTAWAFGSNAGLDHLIDGAPVFVNERLAQHYDTPFEGAAVPEDVTFKQASEVGGRGGLLTNGSILTLTSFRTRTSPVRRGAWVLGRLLCAEPPPPPAGVEDDFGDVDQRADIRERLAQHRADPTCAACHDSMDPIGLGMEGMDAIGRFLPEGIDTTGTMPDGTSFNGLAELQTILSEDPRLAKCFVRTVWTYALARGKRSFDSCHLNALTDDFRAANLGLRDLFVGMAKHRSFTHRRARQEDER